MEQAKCSVLPKNGVPSIKDWGNIQGIKICLIASKHFPQRERETERIFQYSISFASIVFVKCLTFHIFFDALQNVVGTLKIGFWNIFLPRFNSTFTVPTWKGTEENFHMYETLLQTYLFIKRFVCIKKPMHCCSLAVCTAWSADQLKTG